MKKILKNSIILRTCAVLVVLLLVSLYLASGYLAKYTTSGNADEGSGVAKFDFIINNNETVELDLSDIKGPGDTQTFTFAVGTSSSNEVAVQYDVTLYSSNNLPLNVSLTPDREEAVTCNDEKGTGIIYQIKSTALINPNTQLSKSFTVTVTWPSNVNNVKYAGVNEAICLKITGAQVN